MIRAMAKEGLTIQELDFQAVVNLDVEPELRLLGNADARMVDTLGSLVTSLHGELTAARASYIQIDIRKLEFMSAGCFNLFVTWLGSVNELAPEQRYQLRFTTNPAIAWQRRSLRTLSCFATGLVTVA
jgi:hypothetical protein